MPALRGEGGQERHGESEGEVVPDLGLGLGVLDVPQSLHCSSLCCCNLVLEPHSCPISRFLWPRSLEVEKARDRGSSSSALLSLHSLAQTPLCPILNPAQNRHSTNGAPSLKAATLSPRVLALGVQEVSRCSPGFSDAPNRLWLLVQAWFRMQCLGLRTQMLLKPRWIEAA